MNPRRTPAEIHALYLRYLEGASLSRLARNDADRGNLSRSFRRRGWPLRSATWRNAGWRRSRVPHETWRAAFASWRAGRESMPQIARRLVLTTGAVSLYFARHGWTRRKGVRLVRAVRDAA